MKYHSRLEMESGSNHDFPRLARESGFYFNLYHGRVDWKQIDSLDVDQLIRERDLESLQSVFTSISSCNLTNEYDVKVLDPNFVKLFRLSQLSVDYLQYCRNYLDHCVMVLQGQLQVALHEVEELQQERQTKEDHIKQLTKKLKNMAKICGNNGLTTNVTEFGTAGVPGTNSGFSQPYRCNPCQKIFVSAIFLQRHIMRRHPEQVKHLSEAENLRLEVDQLQERLQKAEQLLKQSSCTVETKNNQCLSKHVEETVVKDSRQTKVDRSQNTDEELGERKPSQDDVSQKQSQLSEGDIRILLENFKHQSEEIESLKNQLRSQHFAQESLWQNRLDQLEQRHHSHIDALRTSLSQPNSLTMQSADRTSKEVHEKEVQISRPEMVMKGTQVGSSPERILPQPIQGAFTKPTPKQAFSSMPSEPNQNIGSEPNPYRCSEPNPYRCSEPIHKETPKKQWSSKDRSENRQPAIQQHPQNTRQEEPPILGSQPFSRMSGDISSDQSSTTDSSGSSVQGTLHEKAESETEESSSTTENGIKELSSLATQPQVLGPLRQDIEGVMFRLLRELGIDPEWKGIPNGTYESVRANLQHQRSITEKGRRDLAKLRQDLSREVDKKAKKMSHSSQKVKPPVRNTPARPPPPRSFPSKNVGNEYSAEPRREMPVKPIVVYEEVENTQDLKNSHQAAPVPPTRRRTWEKSPNPAAEPAAPVPPPRVTPTTAELLADMEKLRQQGTLLKGESSFMTKSNLKSASSTGNSGNVAKKRVVFLDEKGDFPTVDLGVNDGELGMFHSRSLPDGNPSDLNTAQSLTASGASRDTHSNLDTLFTNGSGEPVRSAGESRVARMARDIEYQLMNKPKPPSSLYRSPFDHRSNESDLILDDLSSS